ncbi:MAG: HD domain-containing protein [Tissierellia bacterium]|nr:HD domain-containing protein [Tissierellia bacterium]
MNNLSRNKNLILDIEFLIEIDKMKNTYRMTHNTSNNNNENDAEHSWHICMYALVLSKYCEIEIDISNVINMLLVHDLIEIYAGDTFAYDKQNIKDQRIREEEACEKLCELASLETSNMIKKLWYEFEDKETNDSIFANGLDRLQPMVLNYINNGGSWAEHNIEKEDIYKRLEILKKSSVKLWEYGINMINDYFERR